MILVVRRRAIVSKRAGEVELIEEIGGQLPEEADVPDLRDGVDRRIARNGIREIERLRRHQRAPDVRQLTIVSVVERAAERERSGEARAEGVRRRCRQILIDLVVDDLSFRDAPDVLATRACGALRRSLESLVGVVVAAQHVTELQPIGRRIVGRQISEHATELRVVDALVQRPERVVPATVRRDIGCRGMLEAEGDLPVRALVVGVVPVRRRAQQPELQPVGGVSALDVVTARVGEGDVSANVESIGQLLRGLEANRRPLVVVVRSLEHAAVVEIRTAEEERRAVVASRHRKIVVRRVARDVRLVGVVVHLLAGDREIGTPAVAAERVADVVARGGVGIPVQHRRSTSEATGRSNPGRTSSGADTSC